MIVILVPIVKSFFFKKKIFLFVFNFRFYVFEDSYNFYILSFDFLLFHVRIRSVGVFEREEGGRGQIHESILFGKC